MKTTTVQPALVPDEHREKNHPNPNAEEVQKVDAKEVQKAEIQKIEKVQNVDAEEGLKRKREAEDEEDLKRKRDAEDEDG
jgi:hypothetical protein